MRISGWSVICGMTALLSVSACSGLNNGGKLRDVRSHQREPEEFSVVPSKALAAPENYTTLPTPTPGQGNKTDATPIADAVAALGGNPTLTVASGPAPARDGALINSASRYGRDGTIRQVLAQEDADFRKRKSLFTWKIVPEDEYAKAYAKQALDPTAWVELYRRAGAETPSAPIE